MSGAKILRGNASQFFVAGELCRRGAVAVVTLGNCPNTDILCSNPEGTRFAHIQVKTFVPGGRTCSVGMKAEKNYGPKFFWVLAGIPSPPLHGGSSQAEEAFEYFVIPCNEMAKNVSESHRLWLQAPGKKGQPHAADNTIRTVRLPPGKSRNGWDILQYRDDWKPILDVLEVGS